MLRIFNTAIHLSGLLCLTLMPFFMVAQADDKVAIPTASTKYLVEWCWGNHDAVPYIVDHMSFIESMPFDGMVIDNYAGRNFFTSKPDSTFGYTAWSRATISESFKPLHARSFKKFSRNFAKVNMGMGFNPPALTDDEGWQRIAISAQNYAAVLKDVGITGVFLDNEIYSNSPYWIQPLWSLSWSSSYTQKARDRGEQLMRAFMAAYPGIVVIVAHSPSDSCAETPSDLIDYSPNAADLSGYFFSGMALAVKPPAVLVDGGEIYSLRSDSDFARSYQWRKFGMASSPCKVVPDSLRPSAWSEKVSIGFGIYDRPTAARAMNPAIARTTIVNALRHTDAYVWHYSEKLDWWGEAKDKGTIPLVSDDWTQAIKSARDTK